MDSNEAVPIYWLAPECITHKKASCTSAAIAAFADGLLVSLQFSVKSDVFAFAVTIVSSCCSHSFDSFTVVACFSLASQWEIINLGAIPYKSAASEITPEQVRICFARLLLWQFSIAVCFYCRFARMFRLASCDCRSNQTAARLFSLRCSTNASA